MRLIKLSLDKPVQKTEITALGDPPCWLIDKPVQKGEITVVGDPSHWLLDKAGPENGPENGRRGFAPLTSRQNRSRKPKLLP
jgi:hypothetical protein